jgi:hypothetical protein
MPLHLTNPKTLTQPLSPAAAATPPLPQSEMAMTSNPESATGALSRGRVSNSERRNDARLFEKGAQSMRAHFDFPPWTMGSSGDAHHPFARAVGGIFRLIE